MLTLYLKQACVFTYTKNIYIICTEEFFNPAPIGPVGCWIIKYSKFSNSTCSNHIFNG